MAKNYTLSEAVEIIAKGTNLEEMMDLGRRFPVLSLKIAAVAAKAGDDFIDLMSYLPEYLTANKVNTLIKAAITDSGNKSEDEAEDEEETEEEAPKKKADKSAKKKVEKDSEENTESLEWNESMSAKQLWDLLGKVGKRKLAKSTKKADLVEACKKAFGKVVEEDKEEVEEETETSENPYEGKTAVDLFKECKKRGLKAAPKKTAKYYADLLLKDDQENSEEAEEDDWEEEAEEVKAPKKESKKEKAPAKKKAEVVEEDDDDWDI